MPASATRKLMMVTAFIGLAGCRDPGVEPGVRDTAALAVHGSAIGSPIGTTDAAKLEHDLLVSTARPDLIVREGESIQEAVDRAAPGAVIHVEPGIYAQTVTIDKPGIKLLGRKGRKGSGVLLVNPGGAPNGISVTDNGDGVRIAHLTVRGFDRNGIFMSRVQDFFVLGVTAEDNGEYGIFPTRSSDGLMLRCTASGHADAGLYVGQSERVVMMNNVVFGNVIGIEVSNSTDIVVRSNDAFENTIGILAVLLPPAPFRTILVASNILITHNTVTDNNLPNFADPSSLPAFVPSGSGILVVGTDRTVVEHNTVTGNDWVGIGLGSTATFAALAGLPPEALTGLEPDPDGAVIRHNRVLDNGSAPPPAFPLPGVDLLWDGTGTANCWEKNRYETSVPAVLPGC